MLSTILSGKRPLALGLIAAVALITVYSLRVSWPGFSLRNLSAPPFSESNKNVAAIIEDRPLSNLAPLLLHYSAVLGPDWPIVLFTSSSPQKVIPETPGIRHAIQQGLISIKTLPQNINFADRPAITEFLTLPWFWEQLAPAGHVLFFQADSVICANSITSIEDFLSYDFVGAPIQVPTEGAGGHGEGYNGGLSLRNRSMILEIVAKSSWKKEREAGKISQAPCVTKEPCLKFEDQWFYHKMKKMGARLPSTEVASQFSVETIWHDNPLGYHQVDRWQSNRLDEVAKWCPEYKLATGLVAMEKLDSGNGLD